MKERVKRSKSGIVAGVIFFICSVILFILFFRVLAGTSVADGLIPISIIFGGFGTAFLLSGIFTFTCKSFIRKVIITFFVFTGSIIVAVVAATAIMVRVMGIS